MPRGGKREGAGAKSKWKHGRTKTIRVPEVLANEILEFARELDEKGFIETDTNSKVVDLTGLRIIQMRSKKVVFLEDLLRVGYEIKPKGLFEMIRKDILEGVK